MSKITTYKSENVSPISLRKMGFYEKYIKRVIDVICASAAVIVFSPVYIVVAILVRIKLGSPILFAQERPGLIGKDGKETIFKMYKFRTMTDERDSEGNLLPDEKRLTKFGAWLRSTSLDELPEAFCILNGTMSLIGPRPQLVRDMVFMSDEQRKRHSVRPGLTGLAQVNGRNNITWERKFEYDLQYINGGITFLGDMKIIFKTVEKVLKRSDTVRDGMVTDMDFGDCLMIEGKVDRETYEKKQEEARELLRL